VDWAPGDSGAGTAVGSASPLSIAVRASRLALDPLDAAEVVEDRQIERGDQGHGEQRVPPVDDQHDDDHPGELYNWFEVEKRSGRWAIVPPINDSRNLDERTGIMRQ